MVFSLVRELAKILPHVPVWLGGPEVSYDPEETLSALPSAAGVMIGEGEETFRELIELYAGVRPPLVGAFRRIRRKRPERFPDDGRDGRPMDGWLVA